MSAELLPHCCEHPREEGVVLSRAEASLQRQRDDRRRNRAGSREPARLGKLAAIVLPPRRGY